MLQLKVIFHFLWQSLFLLIPVLVNVAFVTLLERKVLGLSQNRKGPNKVYFLGIFQPFSDAVKLFLKEMVFPFKANLNLFFFSPLLALFLMLAIWSILTFPQNMFSLKHSLVFFLFVLSINIYPLFFAGWASNSKYAMIGSIRGISQTISYEISLALIIFSFMILFKNSSIASFSLSNLWLSVFSLAFPLIVLWVISCVAETNRTPFDFSEGESELVSGFNVEYASAGFALLFMAEYGMIIFLSAMTVTLSMTYGLSSAYGLVFQMILVFFWIWLRATFPRFRYDKLMSLGWKVNLPVSLMFLLFFSSLSMFI